MKQLILVYIFLLLSQMSTGQNSHLEGVFAFVYNAQADFPNAKQAISDPSVQRVFENLIEAKGVQSILPPSLTITNTQSVAAWAKPAQRVIGIEKKALDICRSMGKDSLNAIAGLLAHELIHYYENHNWHNHFIHNYAQLSSDLGVENGKQMEMEADDMGGLLAQMAGYNALGIMPKLLEAIYEGYHLDKTASSTYPNLEQRIEMAMLSDRNLRELIPLYEASNYLTVINEVELAAEYLEYIVQKSGFVSREIQNNLGVLYAIAAYQKRPLQEIEFVFPFQLDLDSRLTTKGMDQHSFEALTKKAIHYFNAAKQLDQKYAPAYINLACMYVLLGDNFEAQYHLQKLKKTVPESDAGVETVLGLIAAYDGNHDKAREYWETAASQNEAVAIKNLKLLNPTRVSNTQLQPMDQIVIDKMDLDKLYSMILQEKIAPTLTIDIDENRSFYTVELESSEVYIHLDYEKDEQYCFFHVVDQPNPMLPINIGEPAGLLQDYFGDPDVLITSGNGSVMHYKNVSMIAVVKNGNLSKWCIYKQQL